MLLWTPGPNFKVSPIIFYINLFVFLGLCLANFSIVQFSTRSVLAFGANFAPLVENGEWWRFFTSLFLHLSIPHLLFNSISLLFLGRFIEPLLGSVVFLVVYLATGLCASFASFSFNDNVISAGASGAIFGLFGVFIALLLSKMVRPDLRKQLLQNVAGILALNLGMGLFLPVDNAAHIGGLVSGTVLGFALLPFIRQRLRNRY